MSSKVGRLTGARSCFRAELPQAHLRRSPRYVAVAGVCALLHNAILIGLDRLGVHYALCQTASTAVLLPTGYALMTFFVYVKRPNWLAFAHYSMAMVTNYPIAIASLWLLRGILGFPMVIASPLSLAGLCLWNYMSTHWAFSRPVRQGADK